MKSTSARSPRRASPAPRTRASANKPSSTASRTKSRKADGLTSLLEGGQSIAQTVLKKSRLSGLIGFAPSLVATVGRYARRKPVKTAGMALGLGGLFYLGRTLLRSPGIESSSSFPDLMSETPEAGASEGVPTI